MAIIPFASLVAGTARIAAAEGVVATLGNALIDSFCEDSDNFEEWEALNREGATGALARVANPITRALRNQYCPASPPPRQPLSLGAPIYDQGGDSRGFLSCYVYTVVRNPEPTYVIGLTSENQWNCGQNRGLPVSQPFESEFTPGTIGLFIRLRRADGSEYVDSFGNQRFTSQESGFVITALDITPCNPAIIPILPPIPRLEPPTQQLPPPTRPQYPINITLPGLPGLPPIIVPVVYAPITPTLALEPRITLRPTINLPGLPSFAPDVTLDLGGISIGGGGDVTIGDIENIVNEAGGECPDPCPELDYELIRQIMFEEFDSKFPPGRPSTLQTLTTPPANSATIDLPEFTRDVTLEMVQPGNNTPRQYGGESAAEVAYNGWYSFGAVLGQGTRIPFTYDSASIAVPNGERKFSYTITYNGTAKATVRYIEEI